MKTESFVKIIIDGNEDNLPNVGQVVLHENFDGTIRYSEYSALFKQEWIDIVKWWFKPVHPSPEIPEISDEEIKTWAKKKPQIFQHNEYLSIELGKEVFDAIINARIEGAQWYRKLREGGKKGNHPTINK